jgi:phospholipase/lecithinase/hemolysin
MSKNQKILFTTFICCFLFVHVSFALTYDNLITFGDSLTDSGNNMTYNSDFYNSENYSGGAYSNGKIWAEYLAEKLGIENSYLMASFIKTGSWNPPEGNVWYNSAFGGAETGTKQLPPGLLVQVGTWANAGIKVPANSLCIIWIGGNNFLNWIDDHSVKEDDYTQITDNAVSDIIQALSILTDTTSGLAATDILIMSLPNLGKTPANNGNYGNDNSEYGTLVSFAFNDKLNIALNTFQASHPDVRLIQVDAYLFMEKAVANPHEFGFNNAVNAALYETKPEHGFNNVDKYLFWDGVHPTTEAHQAIASQIYGKLLLENASDDIFFYETHDNDTIGLEYHSQDFRFESIHPNDYNGSNGTSTPSFIYGMFDFTIQLENNETDTEFTVYLPAPAPHDSKWFKSTAGGWINFDKNLIADSNNDGAVFSEDRKSVTIHITDNGPYDDDDTIGIIKDPSGLGIKTDSDSSSGCFIHTIFNKSYRQ